MDSDVEHTDYIRPFASYVELDLYSVSLCWPNLICSDIQQGRTRSIKALALCPYNIAQYSPSELYSIVDCKPNSPDYAS